MEPDCLSSPSQSPRRSCSSEGRRVIWNSLRDRHNVTNPRVGVRHGGDATDISSSTLWEGKAKQQRKWPHSPSSPHTSRWQLLCWHHLADVGSTGISQIWNPVATTFPWGICSLSSRWPEHRGNSYLLLEHRWFPTSTYIWNARGVLETKILLQHHHL